MCIFVHIWEITQTPVYTEVYDQSQHSPQDNILEQQSVQTTDFHAIRILQGASIHNSRQYLTQC